MPRARYVVGEIERLVDEGASRAEIAVFYRTNAQSRVIEDTLVRRDISYQVIGGTKFYERAEIKDAIAYLTVLGNPQDVVSFTRIVNSPRRGIGQTSLGRVIAHADAMGISIWEAAANADTVPGLGTAAVRALTRFMETMETLRERVEQRVPIGDLLESLLHDVGYIDALKAERTIEAQGREENLAELVEVAREFDATRRGGREHARRLPAGRRARRRRRHAHRRRGARHAHDDPQREGARIPDRVHRRHGGGRLPALARARRGRPRGGAPARLRRRDARDEVAVPHERAAARGVRRDAVRHALALSRRDPARAHRPRRRAAHSPRRRGAAAGVVGVVARRPRDRDQPAPAYRMGDDVSHAAFGAGVVTGVEAGGIVVVRFAGDGSERKLMAEYAPITKL